MVIRVLQRAKREADAFAALAMAGLATMFGLQASINLAVNTALIPAKGMTLPFISYGGSSLVATAFAMGLVLAMSRRRPEAVLPAGPVQRRREVRRPPWSSCRRVVIVRWWCLPPVAPAAICSRPRPWPRS